MNDPKPKNQLAPHERAQSVIISTPTEMYLFSWGWMHRAVLRCKENDLGIVFPGRVAVMTGDNLPELIAAMHAGSVFHIAQKSLVSKAKGAWIVDSISIIDPDEEAEEGQE